MAKEIIIPYRPFISDQKNRPYIDIQIENVGIVVCLLDSGSDYSTFPLYIAHQAKLKLGDAVQESSECAHGDICTSYRINMKITFDEEEMTIPVNFIEKGSEPALIGRIGFFDKFMITFNERKQEIKLKKI